MHTVYPSKGDVYVTFYRSVFVWFAWKQKSSESNASALFLRFIFITPAKKASINVDATWKPVSAKLVSSMRLLVFGGREAGKHKYLCAYPLREVFHVGSEQHNVLCTHKENQWTENWSLQAMARKYLWHREVNGKLFQINTIPKLNQPPMYYLYPLHPMWGHRGQCSLNRKNISV